MAGVKGRSGGTNRKSASELRLCGTFRNTRHAKRTTTVTFTPGAPPCPDYLKGEARAEWERVIADPDRSKVLTVVDGPALAAYCQLHADSVLIAAAKQRAGFKPLEIDRERGTVRAHPLVTMGRQVAQLLKAYCTEFGWTPASRNRVRTTEPPKSDEDEFTKFESPLERLLARRRM